MTSQQHAALLMELADTIPCRLDGSEPDICIRARAAAAELREQKGPTNEDLLQLAAEHLGYEKIHKGSMVEAWDDELITFGRAVFNRFGFASLFPSVDQLAAFIREADGSHSLGAGALAEKIVARFGGGEAQ